MNSILAPIFTRRSIRQFLPSTLTEAQLRDLLEAAMAAPSACAKDPWRFLVVQEKAHLTALAAGLPNGAFLKDAAAGIVVCGDLQAAHDGQLSFLLQDCGAAIENLLVAASLLGLGACWLGVHPRQERIEQLRHLCRIPESILPVAVIALGRPGEEKPPRTRHQDAFVRRETW